MTNDTHLPQSAVCCQLIKERCKTASCLSSYLISRVYDFWKTLDTVCVSLWKNSIGVVQQHSVAISPADEAHICVSVMLGMESPWALMRATCVFCRPLLLPPRWTRTQGFYT